VSEINPLLSKYGTALNVRINIGFTSWLFPFDSILWVLGLVSIGLSSQ
jgi:hypothetical protein